MAYISMIVADVKNTKCRKRLPSSYCTQAEFCFKIFSACNLMANERVHCECWVCLVARLKIQFIKRIYIERERARETELAQDVKQIREKCVQGGDIHSKRERRRREKLWWSLKISNNISGAVLVGWLAGWSIVKEHTTLVKFWPPDNSLIG